MFDFVAGLMNGWFYGIRGNLKKLSEGIFIVKSWSLFKYSVDKRNEKWIFLPV